MSGKSHSLFTITILTYWHVRDMVVFLLCVSIAEVLLRYVNESIVEVCKRTMRQGFEEKSFHLSGVIQRPFNLIVVGISFSAF